MPTSISRGSACGLGSSSPFALLSFTPCSSPPFTPWVVAVGCCVQRVTRGCCRGWLQGLWLGSEVALCVGASRGCSCVLKGREGSWFSLSYRVGLGRVNSTPTADKKKNKFRHFPPCRHIRHGTAIFNPPRHRYSVAFFQKFATQLRHGRY